jgi:hypothetical protein
MPGLVPGIHVSRRLRRKREDVDGRAKPGHDDRILAGSKIPFIIFVDAIFTTLFERLFTNSFDGGCEPPANACVYPPRTGD